MATQDYVSIFVPPDKVMHCKVLKRLQQIQAACRRSRLYIELSVEGGQPPVLLRRRWAWRRADQGRKSFGTSFLRVSKSVKQRRFQTESSAHLQLRSAAFSDDKKGRIVSIRTKNMGLAVKAVMASLHSNKASYWIVESEDGVTVNMSSHTCASDLHVCKLTILARLLCVLCRGIQIRCS